jgi:hypothetical protein
MSSPALPRHRPATRSLHSGNGHPGGARSRETASGPSRIAGRYRYDRDSGAWWWSPEMCGVLSLAAGAADPNTELLLERLHPDDRARVLEALTRACTAGAGFALEVRVEGSEVERTVVLMGEPDTDHSGRVRAVEGMCVDVTTARPPGSEADQVHALQTEVSQLRAAMASRACIEQAKGILMLLTGCGDSVAFELLAHISSHTHRKVRDVAQSITESAAGHARLPDDVRDILRDACPPGQPIR